MLQSIVLGLIGSAAVSALAYRYKALSLSGAGAAVFVGTALFAFGSLAWFGTLLVFFTTSTGLSKWKKRQKRLAESSYEKGGRRDAGQVLANGGLAAIICVVWMLWPADHWWFLFVGVMATVNADTWATEIGSLSQREPISITSGRRVPRGTSGGISLLGSMSAALGALTIGVSANLLLMLERGAATLPSGWWIVVAAFVGGLIGAFADSLLGATIQRMNRCRVCGITVEHNTHCKEAAERLRGWSWMNNDRVNMLSSAIGGFTSLIIGLFM